MDQHQRIVVHVDDPALRRGRLGNLVRVVCRREAGADVQQLADPLLADHVPDSPHQKSPVGASGVAQIGIDEQHLLTDCAIDRIVVLTTKQVVPEPGRMWNRGVDARWMCPSGRG